MGAELTTVEGRLTAERAAEILRRDEPFALAPLLTDDDAAIRSDLRPLFVRATRLYFENADDRNRALTLFGPGVLAKSQLSSDAPNQPSLSVALDGAGRRVDQITPAFQRYDAISDEAILIRDALRECGFHSSIYSPQVASAAAGDAEPYDRARFANADLAIYHFAIASDVGAEIAELRIRRALWYHNITPAGFFRPYAPAFAEMLDRGRAQLAALAGSFDALIADSAFNARELGQFTDRHIDVVPFPMDFRRFDVLPEDPIEQRGRPSWLYVGRIAPNKGLRRLVRCFAVFASKNPDAQLVLAGKYATSDPYYLRLRRDIVLFGIGSNVVFTGAVNDAQLAGLYLHSDLFITLSEHEGFCAPLIEAMFYDLPIVASVSGAIPETLGEAGLMVEDDATSADVAALAELLLSDGELYAQLINAQRTRRWAFLPEASSEHLTIALGRALTTRRQTR